jgi:GTP-binding protein
LAALRKSLKKSKIYPLSSATGRGVKELLAAVAKALAKAPTVAPAAPEPPLDWVIEPDFRVDPAGPGRFRIGGRKVDRLVSITHFEQDESVSRLQNILKKMGVEENLIRIGAVPGDKVELGEREFTFRPDAKKRP